MGVKPGSRSGTGPEESARCRGLTDSRDGQLLPELPQIRKNTVSWYQAPIFTLLVRGCPRSCQLLLPDDAGPAVHALGLGGLPVEVAAGAGGLRLVRLDPVFTRIALHAVRPPRGYAQGHRSQPVSCDQGEFDGPCVESHRTSAEATSTAGRRWTGLPSGRDPRVPRVALDMAGT